MLELLMLDRRGHHPGCPEHGKDDPPMVVENSTHVDLFCDCHSFKEPLVLKNGTDIAWPAGWTESEADAWRMANNMVGPESPPCTEQDTNQSQPH
jgi:hypothetical protein